MSQHSDDVVSYPTSDGSFWEPGNYKWTTKRIEDGNKLCNEYVALLKERADIEKTYAKNLRGWAKKWEDFFEKGPEYGTAKESWRGAMTEAQRLADLHTLVKDRIVDDVCQKIALWQKDNYHKSMMQLKEKKEMDERFRKEQKPWEKLYVKVNKAKADYHNACKAERSALNNKLNATRDSSALSPEAAKKVDERVDKAKDTVAKTRIAYEASLREISDFNPLYRDSMTKVFDVCQENEAVRLQFVKDVLYAAHNCLNISSYPQLSEIYEEFRQTIESMDDDRDLQWWSSNRGINMPMNWPRFEEYAEEFRDISKKSKSGGVADSSITLINQRSFGDELPETSSEYGGDSISSATGKKTKKELKSSSDSVGKKSKSKSGSSSSDASSSQRGRNPLLEANQKSKKESSKRGNAVAAVSAKRTNGHKDGTLYEDEEWDEGAGNDTLVDSGEIGVPVKAIYDYGGVEEDELTFKAGEVFEKLEEEDEQGWCKGRKNGKVGLFPANYVTTL